MSKQGKEIKLTQDPREDIKRLVNEYKRIFRQEYLAFIKAKRPKREKAGKFGKIQGGTGVTERLVYEVPETLFSIMLTQLPRDAFVWWGSEKGMSWFVKAYPEFLIPEKF